LQAHCQSPQSQHADQSFVKELAKPTQDKIVLKNLPTLQKIKNATHNPTDNDTDTESQQSQWFTRTDDKNHWL
jgi:hypothetical protein